MAKKPAKKVTKKRPIKSQEPIKVQKPVEAPKPTRVNMSEPDVKELYARFRKARKEGKSLEDSITFKGSVYVLGYLKYLLQYLASRAPGAGIKKEELYK